MWKLENFSAIQKFREIIFGELQPSKTTILTILVVLNLDFGEFLQFFRAEIFQNHILEPQKLSIIQLLVAPKYDFGKSAVREIA